MKDKTSSSSLTPPGASSRRKEKHVSRACNGCRRRKSKCDGVQPVCGTCAAQQHDCTWTAEEDGRRPATKAQVDAMSMEIRALKDERDRQEVLVDRLRDEIRRLGGSTSLDQLALSAPIPSPPRTPASATSSTGPLSITIPGSSSSVSALAGLGVPPGGSAFGHARAVSEGAIAIGGGYLGIPSPSLSPFGTATGSLSPFSHGGPGTHSPFAHSPVSVTSSLPSPLPGMGSGQFLTVPGQSSSSTWRGASPEPSSYGSSTDDDEPRSAMSDSELDAAGDHNIMGAFVSTGKRLLIYGDDDDMVALSGTSPLALSCSPPRTPARSRASSFRGSISAGSVFLPPGSPRPGTSFSDSSIDPSAGSSTLGVNTAGNLSTSNLVHNLSAFRFPTSSTAASPISPHPPASPFAHSQHATSTSVFSITSSTSSGAGGVQSPTTAYGALSGGGGVEHDAECPCDWSRHLPRSILRDSSSTSHTLGLSQEEHDATLKDYFYYVSSWQMRVVPKLFLRDMRAVLSTTPPASASQSPPAALGLGLSDAETEMQFLTSGGGMTTHHRVSHYSASLHCAILAEAGAVAPPDSILAQRSTRDLLAKTAREYVDLECTTAHARALPSVLALSILAQYHLGSQRGARLAFALFGMAVRLALSAGMNMDARNVVLDDEELWEREWCWCALFVQDVDMSLHVGQELTMLPPRDSNLYFSHPGDGLVGETFSRTISLMRLAAQMMALLGANGGGHAKPTISAVSALQTELARWQADLPDPLQIHRASTSNAPAHILVLHMAAQWVTILLHRPYYAGPGWTEDSRKFIDDACNKLLRTIGTYDRLYGLRKAPLAVVQIVFVGGAAALIRADTLSHTAQKRRHEALGLAKQASDALRELAVGYPCAAGYADALDSRADQVREHAGRHIVSPPSLGHQRASSSLSVSGASVASSTSLSHAVSTPSPTLDIGPSAVGSGHAHSHSVPAVVVQDTNGGASPTLAIPMQEDVTSMELDPASSGLFNAFGGPADFSSLAWAGDSPFATVTGNNFAAPYGSLNMEMFNPDGHGGSLFMPDQRRRDESTSENVDMLGVEQIPQQRDTGRGWNTGGWQQHQQ